MASVVEKHEQPTLGRPPAWFRYGVVAATMLILCSCRAASPLTITQDNPPALQATEEAEPAFISDQNVALASHSKPASPVSLGPSKSGVVNAYYETATDRENEKSQVNLLAEAPPSRVVRAQYDHCQECMPPTMAHCVCGPEACGIGPADEYLCDGGDFGTPAGVRADWQIDGLEQEDTIAHYDTVDGRVVVTPSNRVCLYAPRFGAVRQVVDLYAYARYEMPGGIDSGMALARIDEEEQAMASLNQRGVVINRGDRPPSLMMEQLKPGELALDVEVREFDGALAPYANLLVIRAGEISIAEKAMVQQGIDAALTWIGDQSPEVSINKRSAQAEVGVKQPGTLYSLKEPNCPKLRLIKLASTKAAQPGEEVEFTLRFDNVGNRVIGNVTIVDNLTTRLEYIPDTAEASVKAEFSTSQNDHGSLILRWEITEPVEPGEGGILKFKCRVR